MTLPKKHFRTAASAAAALSLVAAFGATSAQAVDFKPAPDGRFEHCVTREEFPQAVADLGQRAIASWENLRTETGKESWTVKAVLTIDARDTSNSQKKWIAWSGWDKDELKDGKTPALYCADASGKGIQVTNGTMPEKPFGYSYATPANPVMGNQGEMFYKNFLRGETSNGSYPVILTNIGNNSFMTFYESSARLTAAATKSTGATKPTMTGLNFKFPDSIRKELAMNEMIQRTASFDISN